MKTITLATSWIIPKGGGNPIRVKSAERTARNMMLGFGRELGADYLRKGGLPIAKARRVKIMAITQREPDEILALTGWHAFMEGVKDSGAVGEIDGAELALTSIVRGQRNVHEFIIEGD